MNDKKEGILNNTVNFITGYRGIGYKGIGYKGIGYKGIGYKGIRH